MKLTPLQELTGRIVLDVERGWRVEEVNGDIALGEPTNVPAGSHEARGRATTTQRAQRPIHTRPEDGIQEIEVAREVWILALDDGELRALRMDHGTFEPA